MVGELTMVVVTLEVCVIPVRTAVETVVTVTLAEQMLEALPSVEREIRTLVS